MKTLFQIMPHAVALTLLSMCFGIMGNIRPTDKSVRYLANVNQADDVGNTALHWAARESHVAVVTALLKAGANVNKANKYGDTALHYAVMNGHEDVVKLLLKAGANVGQVNHYGNTALHYARENGHAGIAAAISKEVARRTRWSDLRSAWVGAVVRIAA